jgi:uncharacterized protein YjbJ (UPF0337 family)
LKKKAVMVKRTSTDYWHMFRFTPTKKSDIRNDGLHTDGALMNSLKQKLTLITDDDLGSWSDIKRKLKQTFASLTDNDLLFYEGREEELIKRILRKVGNDNLNELLEVLNKFY